MGIIGPISFRALRIKIVNIHKATGRQVWQEAEAQKSELVLLPRKESAFFSYKTPPPLPPHSPPPTPTPPGRLPHKIPRPGFLPPSSSPWVWPDCCTREGFSRDCGAQPQLLFPYPPTPRAFHTPPAHTGCWFLTRRNSWGLAAGSWGESLSS